MHGNMTELSVPKSARGPHTNRDYKLVVVGHRAVGKSALVVRFLTKRFISEYQENSEMTCNGVVEVDGENLHLKIQDTSEKGIRVPTVDHHFRWADAIMLVYSVTDKTSYQRLRYAATRLKERLMDDDNFYGRSHTMVVVGNKGDLDHIRQVSPQQGLQLADELGCEFYETSASEGWSRYYYDQTKKAPQQPLTKARRRNGVHELQRPTTLWEQDKHNCIRRKSDPAVALNAIFGIKTPPTVKSPANDMNNNDSKNVHLTVPTVPQISISPSEEVPNEQTQSRGRKLMQKLSPRFSRKFGNTKTTHKPMSTIGASLARMGTAGLAVSTLNRKSTTCSPSLDELNRERCHTLPAQLLRKTSAAPRIQTLRADGRCNGTLLDSSSSSNSSTESLVVPGKESTATPTFFLRPETPVSDITASSSEDEASLSTLTHGFPNSASNNMPLRRSRSICRNLNIQGIKNERSCNSDSDSSKNKLYPAIAPRAVSETRTSSSNFNENFNESNNIHNDDDNSSAKILHEKKFNASEPFKHLCREARNARRLRERRTPSKMLRDGIRKIKTSFANDQAHQNNNHGPFKNPHFLATAVRH